MRRTACRLCASYTLRHQRGTSLLCTSYRLHPPLRHRPTLLPPLLPSRPPADEGAQSLSPETCEIQAPRRLSFRYMASRAEGAGFCTENYAVAITRPRLRPIATSRSNSRSSTSPRSGPYRWPPRSARPPSELSVRPSPLPSNATTAGSSRATMRCGRVRGGRARSCASRRGTRSSLGSS